MEYSSSYSFSEEEKMALTISMCGPLLSKVKFILKNALKNTKVAQNDHIVAIVELIAEHLVPEFCAKN